MQAVAQRGDDLRVAPGVGLRRRRFRVRGLAIGGRDLGVGLGRGLGVGRRLMLACVGRRFGWRTAVGLALRLVLARRLLLLRLGAADDLEDLGARLPAG